jgi:hypothetical protein
MAQKLHQRPKSFQERHGMLEIRIDPRMARAGLAHLPTETTLRRMLVAMGRGPLPSWCRPFKVVASHMTFAEYEHPEIKREPVVYLVPNHDRPKHHSHATFDRYDHPEAYEAGAPPRKRHSVHMKPLISRIGAARSELL